MIALALALLAVQGPSPDSLSARAESLLAAGNVQGALKIASKLAQRRRNDPQAHFLLGRVHFERPLVGRWAALEEFKKAARLAPQDPALLAATLRALAAEPPQVSLQHLELRFPPVTQFLERFRALLKRRSRFDFDSEVEGLTRIEQAVAPVKNRMWMQGRPEHNDENWTRG